MVESLTEYERKRHFEQTPEPRGDGRRKPRKGEQALQFCIQKHDASHLHYDFRLELDGTLKSWAVPKGPSLDPADKRLAIHVEDHPLDYASFEGHIPEGHYGGGDVIVWDRGTWEPEGEPHEAYAKGRLKFRLQGEKLAGTWNLVKTRMAGKKEQWFLIKSHDEQARAREDYDILEDQPGSVLSDRALVPKPHGKAAAKVKANANANAKAGQEAGVEAKPIGKKPAKARAKRGTALEGARQAPLPAAFKPQLATLVDSAPPGDWRYEIKFDGYRILARIEQGKAKLFTRNGHDWTARMPQQAKALEALGLEQAWLDGEVVVANEQGVPDFQALQNAFETERSGEIVYYLFDVLYLNGMDLTSVPLEQRRAALAEIVGHAPSQWLRYSDDFAEDAEHLLGTACQMHMEGLIGKRAGSLYHSTRNADWIKLKCQHRQEFVVVGYTEPKGSRSDFGALLLGLHDPDSGGLRYAGKVGTGFSEQTLKTILAQLQPLQVPKRPPLANAPSGAQLRGVHWLKPQLLAEVAYAEMTREGAVRHAVFHGLRDDKPAEAINEEKPAQVQARQATTGKKNVKHAAAEDLPSNVRITHPDRIIDKTTGATKLDLARYYTQVAQWILPQLADRPVALVRAPEGIEGELFFQKNAEHLHIPGIKGLDKAFSNQPVMIVDTPQALIGAVQMGTVEFHTWNATGQNGRHPDRFVLDLDPDPALPWKAMAEATELVLAALGELGLKSFLKTSGGKGMHIVVPLRPKDDWDQVKDFAHALVSHMAKLMPDRFSDKSGPKNRVGKIFIDYLRNGEGATTACAYGARAREGLPVSVPVAPEEVAGLKTAARWNIHTLGERLAELSGDDPWAGYGKVRQGITQAMRQRLGIKAR
ncbi:DNA ligase D [Pseudomonas typographi]|uniref:DNA ligase D n=1 Tax=Pseudomonas typographi TaxID=2715964 RepID=UPI0016855BB4|nr:DNA ligase D [Pseudomonas typographi]MBD1589536.1 DNA ligase D [Pseudomonas typographi]